MLLRARTSNPSSPFNPFNPFNPSNPTINHPITRLPDYQIDRQEPLCLS